MNPRWAAVAPWCREIALPASVLAVLVALGSASSGTNKVAPFVNRVAPSLTADVKFADRPPHITADKTQIATAADLEFVKAANALVAISAAGSTPACASATSSGASPATVSAWCCRRARRSAGLPELLAPPLLRVEPRGPHHAERLEALLRR